MKVTTHQLVRRPLACIAVLAAGALPTMAIEPPVDSAPIPPQEPAKPVPAPADNAAPADKGAGEVVPMPEVGEERPYIGVILDPLPALLTQHLRLKEGEGVMITELVAGGPAEEAGLKINDLLVEVAGESVGNRDEVRAQVEKHKVGDEVELGIIHDGERKKVTVKLGAAPRAMAGRAVPVPEFGAGQPLDGLFEGLPEKHADAIREALEMNLRQFQQLDADGENPAAELQAEMMKRMQRQMGGFELQMGDIDAVSSIRLLDDEGSIEMKQSNGSKEAKVFDKQGKLLWEGPYDTEQDKAAVPDGIRERIESLDFDIRGNGQGMQLRLGPNRFRPLDDIEPDEDIPAPDAED